MNFSVDEHLKALMPRLTEEERKQLELNLLEEGCREPLIVWEEKNLLVDGHNRYEFCTKHNIDYEISYKSFPDIEAVEDWIVNNQVGRRNLNMDWFRYLVAEDWKAGRKVVAKNKEAKREGLPIDESQPSSIGELTTNIAQKYNLSEPTVRNHNNFRSAVDSVVNNLGPNYKHKILDGEIKITHQEVKELASLPAETQKTYIEKIEQGEAKNLREARRIDIRESAAVIDDISSKEVSIVVEPGQWWKLGDHYIYCGDTSDPAFYDVLPEVDFAFADPPYNVGVDEWDHDFIWGHNWLTKKSPVVAITPGHRGLESFCAVNAASEDPMKFRWSVACWITNGMKRGDLGYSNWIHVLLYGDGKIFRDSQDVCRVTINNAETEETTHRGRKPTELLVWLIETFTNPGQRVIDPFLGSGTTLLASEKTGRRFIGGEKDPLYCVEIIGRWEALTGLKAELVEELNF